MAVDKWAATQAAEVVAQIGGGVYLPANMAYHRTLAKPQYVEFMSKADVVVAHAGMGSVITAKEIGVPIVLMPRLAKFREHTTDHQLDTARRLADVSGILVALDEHELPDRIEQARTEKLDAERWDARAPAAFLDKIRDAIAS